MTSGTEKRARSSHITIRLTEDERAAVNAAAEDAGLTPGSYVRQVVLGAPVPRQGKRRPTEKTELVRLLGEVGKIGSNLNQLAHRANSGDAVKAQEVETALAGLHKMRASLLKALGREP
ncbi:MAG: plasmid mobilization relaxosome protein MobC [Rhizomicrobium sp.]